MTDTEGQMPGDPALARVSYGLANQLKVIRVNQATPAIAAERLRGFIENSAAAWFTQTQTPGSRVCQISVGPWSDRG